jgi:hypothetical protein
MDLQENTVLHMELNKNAGGPSVLQGPGSLRKRQEGNRLWGRVHKRRQAETRCWCDRPGDFNVLLVGVAL